MTRIPPLALVIVDRPAGVVPHVDAVSGGGDAPRACREGPDRPSRLNASSTLVMATPQRLCHRGLVGKRPKTSGAESVAIRADNGDELAVGQHWSYRYGARGAITCVDVVLAIMRA